MLLFCLQLDKKRWVLIQAIRKCIALLAARWRMYDATSWESVALIAGSHGRISSWWTCVMSGRCGQIRG